MKPYFKIFLVLLYTQTLVVAQDFQGTATYMSKSTVDMNFGGRQMSEAQKKMIQERMKSMLEQLLLMRKNKN